MLKIALISFAALVGGYLAGLFGGMALISRFSSNTHDRGVEAATTAAFVIGPAVAILALTVTLVLLLARPDS